MENKETNYYTPDIQDLRVGYECELNSYSKGYTPFTFNTMTELAMWATPHQLSKETVRTEFLTKEQIEAEGWEYTSKAVDLWFRKAGRFEIGNWTSYLIVMHYGVHDRRLFINALDAGDERPIFEGECKSINEFRSIIKWLKIN